MLVEQGDEISRGVARQGRLAKVRIAGEEVLRPSVQVGEIAAASAGDEDLLADAFGMLEYGNTPVTLAGFNGAHQPGGAGAQHDQVEGTRLQVTSFQRALIGCQRRKDRG